MTGAPLRLLLTADAVGGVWQYATDLARALAPYGVETVLAAMGPSPSPDRLADARDIPGVTVVDTGLELDWLAENAGAVKAAGRRIAELAGDHRVDVAQLNMPALAADARFAMPVVAVAHSCVATWWDAMRADPLPEDFRWRSALVGGGLRRAARAVAPSAAFAGVTEATYRLPSRPSVVHNGRAPVVADPSAMHDFAFTAGRLWDAAKNVDTIDRAAARLVIPFKVAGPLEGPHGERVRFDHLHATGPLDDQAIATMLASRPVFVSAARYEPFGLAVLEAAAAGCALVLSDIPTFRELWDGVALFVDPDDDRGFADAIGAVAGDMQQRLGLGQAAAARAARYTPEAMAAGMMAIYRDLTLPARAAVPRPRVAA